RSSAGRGRRKGSTFSRPSKRAGPGRDSPRIVILSVSEGSVWGCGAQQFIGCAARPHRSFAAAQDDSTDSVVRRRRADVLNRLPDLAFLISRLGDVLHRDDADDLVAVVDYGHAAHLRAAHDVERVV